jgi:hypothetical protein
MTDTPLMPDTRVVIVRRGNMRLMYPMTQFALDTMSAPELAASSIQLFMNLQGQMPGRADMAITSKTGQMCLVLPFKDAPLGEDEPLWVLLAGHWQESEVVAVPEDALTPEFRRCPCVALNLMDLHTMKGSAADAG